MILWVLTAFSVLLAVATLLPLSRHDAWWVRGWDFPRLQLAVSAIVLLALELTLLDRSAPGTWALALVTLACLAYHGWWILPYTPLFRKEVAGAAGPRTDDSLTILCSNVLMTNRNADALLRHVHEQRPDLLIAVETDAWWQQRLDSLRAEYPHVIACPMDNLYGMHLYSRLPLEDARVQYLVEPDIPSAHAVAVLRSGRRVRIHCLHPRPPSPTENPESGERDAELVMVGKSVAKASLPVVVAGDLNDVAWSGTTRLFRKVSKLLDPRVGRGMYNSFHAKWALIRWPLDHLFHSRHFALGAISRLGPIDSDHFPILVRLVYRPDRNDPDAGLEADAEDHAQAQEKMGEERVSAGQVHTPGDS